MSDYVNNTDEAETGPKQFSALINVVVRVEHNQNYYTTEIADKEEMTTSIYIWDVKYQVSREYLSDEGISVEKVNKYTTQDAKQYIDSLEKSEDQDCFILHILCNEVKTQIEEYCIDDISATVSRQQEKCPDAETIISLILNRKTEMINIMLNEAAYEKKRNTYISDNSNLFYRGHVSRGILNDDGLHSSRQKDVYSELRCNECFTEVI